MKDEIDYRTRVLRPKLIEDVQTARAFGDLSVENHQLVKQPRHIRAGVCWDYFRGVDHVAM